MNALKRTPIFNQHKALRAKLVPFAGWEMPVEYKGILAEHEAVRTNMGLFDVSHMGEIEIRGRRALDYCQRIATNDASSLKPGKIQYSCFLNDKGGIIDDCTLYRISEENFIFVVNASRRDRVMEWFTSHPMDNVEVVDRSDEYALLALQGRNAEKFLSRIIKRDLDTVGYYEFILTEFSGTAAIISRTGYTGEDGFEIYLPTNKGAESWEMLLREGAADGLQPIGLGARDTLRLEMGYLLYGNDMNEEITPLEAGLSWIVKMEKGNFIGRDALVDQKKRGVEKRLRGFKMKGRAIPRAHYELNSNGKKTGEVTSGTFSPSLKSGIGMGYVASALEIGNEISVVMRGREEAATLVKPPFVTGSVKK
jgi:aminomethyltransferase